MSNSTRTILVTGATGFVGSHVVDVLLEAGYQVRCTVRATSRLRWLKDKPVEVVEADLVSRFPKGLASGVYGVFHFAGLTRGSRRQLDAVNHDGTRALLACCAKESPGAWFVFCSSQAAAGPSSRVRPRREEDPPKPTTDYGRSKLAAEQQVLQFRGRLRPVILRPAAVYGPRDEDTLTFFRMAARGFLLTPGLRPRLLQMVHARDVAMAALAALGSPGADGKTFFIAHPQILTWDELALSFGRATNRTVLRIPVPGLALRIAGNLASIFGTGRHAGHLDRRKAKDLLEEAWTCQVSRALEELSWSPIYDVDRGLKDTVSWYRKENWL